MKKQKNFLILILFFFCGCGPNYYLKKAQKNQEKKLYSRALTIYEDLVRRYPDRQEVVTAALWGCGIIQRKLKNYSAAVEYFQLLKNYPQWKTAAEKEIFRCPDYFPLKENNLWVEGDSQSLGKNMRAVWKCRKVNPEIYEISRTISAGTTQVSVIKSYYFQQGQKLLEAGKPDLSAGSVFLDYPFTPGKKWETSRSGQKLLLTVISNQATVNTRSGQFSKCLKIAEQIPGYSGITYRYYAPDTGWVLTTTGKQGSEKEYRNSELLSCQIKPED